MLALLGNEMELKEPARHFLPSLVSARHPPAQPTIFASSHENSDLMNVLPAPNSRLVPSENSTQIVRK